MAQRLSHWQTEAYAPQASMPSVTRSVVPREQARLLQDSESGTLRTVAVLQAPFSKLGLNEPQQYASPSGTQPRYQDYHQHQREEEYLYYRAAQNNPQQQREEAYYYYSS
jgi:hypothetical protein